MSHVLPTEATLRVEELMRSMAEQFTIVIVTHNMAQARRVSDECLFMLLGELIEHSELRTFFQSYAWQDGRLQRADMDDLAHPSASSFLSRGCSTLENPQFRC